MPGIIPIQMSNAGLSYVFANNRQINKQTVPLHRKHLDDTIKKVEPSVQITSHHMALLGRDEMYALLGPIVKLAWYLSGAANAECGCGRVGENTLLRFLRLPRCCCCCRCCLFARSGRTRVGSDGSCLRFWLAFWEGYGPALGETDFAGEGSDCSCIRFRLAFREFGNGA